MQALVDEKGQRMSPKNNCKVGDLLPCIIMKEGTDFTLTETTGPSTIAGGATVNNPNMLVLHCSESFVVPYPSNGNQIWVHMLAGSYILVTTMEAEFRSVDDDSSLADEWQLLQHRDQGRQWETSFGLGTQLQK